MNRLLLFGLPLVALPVVLQAIPRAPFEARDELASLMPANSLVYVEGPGLAPLLASGLEHPLLAKLLDSELARAALNQAALSPQAALELADAYLGEPLLPTLARLCSRGAAFSIGIKRGKPTLGLVLRGEDAVLLRATLERLLGKLAEQFGQQPAALTTPSDNIRGVDTWYIGEQLALGIKDELLLAASDEGRLRDLIDLGAADVPASASLLSSESFRSAHSLRGEKGTLWSYINLAAIERETGNGARDLRAMASNPGVHFLLGPAVAALGSAQDLSLELQLEDERLELQLSSRGLPEGPLQRVLYASDAPAPSLPKALAEDGAVALLYRDLAGLFRERTELFPAEVLPKFSEAIANFSFLFGGGDITDEVLPALSPWIGLIVRDPLFRGGAMPEVKLPGAALIAHLNDSEKLGERMIAGFQSMIGFINIDGAQRARPPMLLDIELHEGVKISSAHFPTPSAGEGVDLRYNLEPACAVVGDTFVIATHASLVRSILAQIQRGEMQPLSTGREALELAGATVARAVRENSEALVMNAVLNDGKAMEQARAEIGGLEKLAEMIGALEFTTERLGAGELRLSLALDLGAKR